MQNGGGCRGHQHSELGSSIHSPLLPIPYPLSFHILAHSFAFAKTVTLLFSWNCALFDKNTRGWGTLRDLPRGTNVDRYAVTPELTAMRSHLN